MSSGSSQYKIADPICHPVKGIRNHGNTCFFNAMLQAVNQTDQFHELYVMKPYERKYTILDTSYSVSVPQPNEVSKALCETFQQFTKSGNQPISSKSLLKQLGKRHPRFLRGTQEDSHEALRALLEDIKYEEIEDIKKKITSQFNAKSDFTFQDGEKNLELKSHLRMANKVDVAISKAVQGSIVSVVICHECHEIVENVEPFFDLSLPIVKKSPIKKLPDFVSGVNDALLDKGSQKNLQAYEEAPSKYSGLGKRKASSVDDDHQTKRQKTLTHDINIFQEYLKKNDCKHLYRNATQKDTVQKFHTDLEHCLLTFTDLDVLDEDNKFICKSCTERKHQTSDFLDVDSYSLCCVSKQLMIHQLPPVLILHMKRFEISQYRVIKDSRYVSFPEILDMAPYCTDDCVKEQGDSTNQILYGLYAVVIHHGGSLYSGHYVSYVKTRPSKAENTDEDYCRTEYDRDYSNKGQWYLANDSSVQECQFKNIKGDEAYMLFYEQLPLRHNAYDTDEVI